MFVYPQITTVMGLWSLMAVRQKVPNTITRLGRMVGSESPPHEQNAQQEAGTEENIASFSFYLSASVTSFFQ